MVSEPASPHSAASGISPIPALSRTINVIRSNKPSPISHQPFHSTSSNLKMLQPSKPSNPSSLPLPHLLLPAARIIPFPRTNQRLAGDALHSHTNLSILSVQRLIHGVVSNAVLGTDLLRNLSKRRFRVPQFCSVKCSRTRNT